MRLFTMPTNRSCAPAAASYLPELAAASARTGADLLFAVVGDGDAATEAGNQDAFAPLARGTPPIHYLSRDSQARWLASVLRPLDPRLSARLMDLLMPPAGTCSYGAVLDRTFLIAASLGIEYVHRRDSDTRRASSDPDQSPLLREIEYLGEPYRSFPALGDSASMPICFAGANYSGEWPADLKALYQQDPRLLYRYIALTHPERSLDEIAEFVARRFLQKGEVQEGTVRLVKEPVIELGNCAYYKVFERYPVSAARNTIGTDYFIQEVLATVGLRSVCHGLKVDHFYTPERSDERWAFGYHMRFPKFKIYSALMHDFHKRLGAFFNTSAIAALDELPEAAALASILGETLVDWRCSNRSLRILEELALIYGECSQPTHRAVAAAIAANTAALVAETLRDIDDFAFLLRSWRDVVGNARRLPFPI